MYFEFGSALQAGVDCAGDAAPGLGTVFGWVRHPAGDALSLRVESAPGRAAPTRLLSVHGRPDVRDGEGMAVTGFTLLHDLPEDATERTLVLSAGEEEAGIDLLGYDLPSDVEASTAERHWGATFDLLHAALGDPALAPLLGPPGSRPGVFRTWFERLPRLAGGSGEWFMDFRRVTAASLSNGEYALSASLAVPGEAALSVMAFPLWVSGPEAVPAGAPGGRARGFRGGLAAGGVVDGAPPPGAGLDLVVQARRGAEAWWFRAEAPPATLPVLLDALCLAAHEMPPADTAACRGWAEEILATRVALLAPRLPRPSRHAGPARGASALLFGLDEPYAARLIALLAPSLEASFPRLVLSGRAAPEAAERLGRRGRAEVRAASDAAAALALLPEASPLVLADPDALAAAVCGAGVPALAERALEPGAVHALTALHEAAGPGPVEATLARVVSILWEEEPGAAARLPMPGGRPGPLGALVSAHLRALWHPAEQALSLREPRAATRAADAAA